jgi:hypothetical protein
VDLAVAFIGQYGPAARQSRSEAIPVWALRAEQRMQVARQGFRDHAGTLRHATDVARRQCPQSIGGLPRQLYTGIPHLQNKCTPPVTLKTIGACLECAEGIVADPSTYTLPPAGRQLAA